jgi:hypothetical protein
MPKQDACRDSVRLTDNYLKVRVVTAQDLQHQSTSVFLASCSPEGLRRELGRQGGGPSPSPGSPV